MPIGVVAIGRNEGQRLNRCLASATSPNSTIVYVDSGSTDNSVETAQDLGATTVTLDLSLPFTAARARNAGFQRLLQVLPDLEMVQFVDGDCEIVAGWLEKAEEVLRGNSNVAVVCGRRRELYPKASLYNHLCDMEWDTPIGLTQSCGGDALMRVEALVQVGGFDANLIAGEEPDLCFRLREKDWNIVRIDVEMTRHDAAMTHFSQWLRRSIRTGHAFAEGNARHGRSAERFWARETRSALFWGLGVPALMLLAFPAIGTLSLGIAGIYGILMVRTYRNARRRGFAPEDARLYAFYCVAGKTPEALGQLTYWLSRLTGRRQSLIEYKTKAA